MRKLIVIAVILIFALYCYKVNENYTLVYLPQYEIEDVNIIGDKTLDAWDDEASGAYRAERLTMLESHRYHPVEPIQLKDGKTLQVTDTLTQNDFRAIIEAKRNGVLKPIQLRNPAGLHSLASRHLLLRNDLPITLADGKSEVIKQGTHLDKKTLDRILESKQPPETVGVVGIGNVVSVEAGTLVMVILIFVGLAMALRDLMWDPVLSMLDSRTREIQEGAELGRKNRHEEAKLGEERNQKLGELRRDYLERLSATQREARTEADGILQEAKHEAHKIRDKGMKEINASYEQAEEGLRKQVPELSKALASQLLGREVKG